MDEFAPVEFKSTIVRFNIDSHVRMTKWAAKAKMRKGEFIKHLMNEAIRQYKKDGKKPEWMNG